jgi:hypothetical protein
LDRGSALEQFVLVGLQFVGRNPFGFREHIAELKDHFVVAIHDGGAAP